MRTLVMAGLMVTLAAGAAEQAAAQAQAAPPARHVVSANPFGLLVELFNAEFERKLTGSTSIGLGGSTASVDTYDYDANWNAVTRKERYVNGDVFLRYYPAGGALKGLALGVKAGATVIPEQGTFAGLGIDVNRSWIMGRRQNVYVSTGFGLKRLYGTDDEAFELKYVPTLRLVNVGIAF